MAEPSAICPPTPYRCISPQCPNDCSQCNHAVPGDDAAAVLVADLLQAFAVNGHGGPLEDGESALVDRARAWLRGRAAASSPESEVERLQEQLACVRQALPEALRESELPVAVASLTAGMEYDERRLQDLAMAVRMLASSLRRHWPSEPRTDDLPSRAVDLLRRHRLLGSSFRR